MITCKKCKKETVRNATPEEVKIIKYAFLLPGDIPKGLDVVMCTDCGWFGGMIALSKKSLIGSLQNYRSSKKAK